tara:strand:- start:330 stop:1346 length:1017 start_codon:yes stop_codon:yes gene_type:complete
LTLVSIAVCVRNGLDWIDGCLESLVNQTHRPIEIILVDDGSTDGSKEKCQSWSDHELVQVISQSQLGLSAGRMAALDASKGEWFAITDIDTMAEADWIQRMLESSISRESEDVVAVTGRTVFSRAEDVISTIRSIEIESKYRSRPRITKLANGPCSMFKRDKLIEIGGFNPKWYHAEDMEVSLKLVQAGGIIVYTNDAVVNHVPETGLRRFLEKRRRDARAHVRIHRRYKRVKHDFLGSSWVVLWMLPMIILGIFGISIFVNNVIILETLNVEAFYDSMTTEFLLTIFFPLIWLFSIAKSDLPKTKISSMFVLIAWSFYLWQGIIMGYTDALLKRNGH